VPDDDPGVPGEPVVPLPEILPLHPKPARETPRMVAREVGASHPLAPVLLVLPLRSSQERRAPLSPNPKNRSGCWLMEDQGTPVTGPVPNRVRARMAPVKFGWSCPGRQPRSSRHPTTTSNPGRIWTRSPGALAAVAWPTRLAFLAGQSAALPRLCTPRHPAASRGPLPSLASERTEAYIRESMDAHESPGPRDAGMEDLGRPLGAAVGDDSAWSRRGGEAREEVPGSNLLGARTAGDRQP
jgi:hypothetical protein